MLRTREMESILEQQRRYHEERDRIIENMVRVHIRPNDTARDQVLSEHILRVLLDQYMQVTRDLIDMYRDEDGLRSEELNTTGGKNQFSEFYIKVKHMKELMKKTPAAETAVPLSVEIENFTNGLIDAIDDPIVAASLVRFSDEECWGRCLDLHGIYQKFVQLVPNTKIEYLEFVEKYDRLYEILPQEKKISLNKQYREYLKQLIGYLKSFLNRLHPLQNISKLLEDTNIRFEEEWKSGIFLGWSKSDGVLVNRGAPLSDLDLFDSVEDLCSLGPERLKSALMSMGLKCGGTLEERANRLFAFKENKHTQGMKSSWMTDRKKIIENRSHEMARLEAHVYALSEQLPNHKSATVENIQRKQARAGIVDDEDEDYDRVKALEVESDDADDDIGLGSVYNPKDLPLGWDGKPIPYWLYKLHGLNIYYNCEICGNFRYRGPKAYQRHFTEWRHAHGMRCLGIPNTPHFANITLIEDAIALWEKLKKKKEIEHFRPDVDEEFEDSAGNVVSRKVFEDLRRQGLL